MTQLAPLHLLAGLALPPPGNAGSEAVAMGIVEHAVRVTGQRVVIVIDGGIVAIHDGLPQVPG